MDCSPWGCKEWDMTAPHSTKADVQVSGWRMVGPLLRYGDPGLGQCLCSGRGLSFPNCSLVSRTADIGDRSIAGWIRQREQQEKILRGGKFMWGTVFLV